MFQLRIRSSEDSCQREVCCGTRFALCVELSNTIRKTIDNIPFFIYLQINDVDITAVLRRGYKSVRIVIRPVVHSMRMRMPV